jgi:hypothetical protein
METKIGKFDIRGVKAGAGWAIYINKDVLPIYMDWAKTRWRFRVKATSGHQHTERALSDYLIANPGK